MKVIQRMNLIFFIKRYNKKPLQAIKILFNKINLKNQLVQRQIASTNS